MRTRNKIQNIIQGKENHTFKDIFSFLHDKTVIYK